MSQLISNLAVGAKIKFGSYQVESSTTEPIIWKIIDKNHSGYPSNSVTVLTDKIIDQRGFDAKEPLNADSYRATRGSNRYRTSNIRQWLNSSGLANTWWIAQNLTDGTLKTNNADTPPDDAGMINGATGYSDIPGFLNNFTAYELSKILDTTLVTAKNTATDEGGSETLVDKIFLLSKTEVGYPNVNGIAEGSSFSIFATNSDRMAYLTNQDFNNTLSASKPAIITSPWYWGLRTPYGTVGYISNFVNTGGAEYTNQPNNAIFGVRPAMNLTNDILVSDTVDADGSYTIVVEKTIYPVDFNLDASRQVGVMSIPMSDLPVGSKIKYGSYKVEGSLTEPIIWKIIDKNHPGYPTNSVTLLTDKIIDQRGFDAKEPINANTSRAGYGNNRYRTSNLRQWLNSNGSANAWWTAQSLADGVANTNNADATPNDAGFNKTTGYDDIQGFLKNFTADELKRVLDTNLMVAKNTVTDGGGSEIVTDKVFLLSGTELGFADENGVAEGSLFPIFATNADRLATVTVQDFSNTLSTLKPTDVSTTFNWWLRTPRSDYSQITVVVGNTGGKSTLTTSYNGAIGVRPAMNLASDTVVSIDSDGYYVVHPNIIFQSQPITNLPIGSRVKFGSYKVEKSNVEPIIWKVVDKSHQGYPSGSITLLTDKVIDLRGFDATEPLNADIDRSSWGSNRYRTSNIRRWLNSSGEANSWWSAQNLADGTLNTNNADSVPSDAGFSEATGYNDIQGFLNSFTEQELAKIMDTTLTVAKNTVTDGGSSETVSDKVFLLSKTEVGLTDENGVAEGSLISSFTTDVDRATIMTNQGYSRTLSMSKPATSTTQCLWTLRTPMSNSSYRTRIVGGMGFNSAYSGSSGLRPALNLAPDTLVSNVVDYDGCYVFMNSIETFLIDINVDMLRKIALSSDLALDLIRQVKASTMTVLDSLRKTNATIDVDSDLLRRIGASSTSTLDTKRTTAVTADLESSTKRRINVLSNLEPDTKRSLSARLDIGIDTKRQVCSGVQMVIADVKRRLVANVSTVAGTKRKVARSVPFTSDVKRKVVRSVSSIVGLKRSIVASISSIIDSKRRLTVSASLIASTRRKVAVTTSFTMDLKRKVIASIYLAIDTRRRISTVTSLSLDTNRKLVVPISLVIETLRKVINYRPHRIRSYVLRELNDRYVISELKDKFVVEEEE